MRGQKGPVKKLQVNISEDLHRSFKGTCVSKGLDMTEVIESLITGWLSEQE
ncbi:plasmid partition protein ParG [Aeromonas caviae]|uniref:plasmid partition protein ParG n=1 Tax=Aeromonas caviae TaxID=648 RepID=UPI003BAF13F3